MTVNSSWYLSVLGIERTESVNWLLYCKANILIFFCSMSFPCYYTFSILQQKVQYEITVENLRWLRSMNTLCVTSWGRFVLEKLAVNSGRREIPSFYGTWIFITVLQKIPPKWALSCGSGYHSLPFQSVSERFFFILSKLHQVSQGVCAL